LINLVKIIVR